jgi:hypothetical protein
VTIERIAYISTTDQVEVDYPFALELLDAGYKIDFGFYWSETKALTAYCTKPHTTFKGAAETANTTVPERDERLILQLAEAYIERMLARDAALLRRWSRLSISDDPTPSQKAHQDLWHGIEERVQSELRTPFLELVGKNVLPVGEQIPRPSLWPFINVEE